MGIYLPNMEMPKSCEDCSIKSWDCEGYVCPFSGIDTLNIGRQSDCPLVPVPPHGRLIDADEIVKQDHQHYEYLSDTFYVTVRDIELAPTIIPASEEDE